VRGDFLIKWLFNFENINNAVGKGQSMQEWNVVINLNERGFRQAYKKLGPLGPMRKTGFFNVLLMKVDDPQGMLEIMREWTLEDPEALSFLSRVIPVTSTFTFQTPEEFEAKAREAVLPWAPGLAGKGFHVRMRRRGFKGKLSSLKEEHFLDDILLASIEKTGIPGHITFEDPDAIIAVETVAQWAGLSFWSREDLERYPFVSLA
jgi:tRNA(Ser,Leu) C12 N-acetylase TAN1